MRHKKKARGDPGMTILVDLQVGEAQPTKPWFLRLLETIPLIKLRVFYHRR